jgi:magnesium-transporting ATPase (P-type)
VQAESNLQFLGCAVFNTPLKAGSVPALKMLAASSHQLVMITGDAPLTACFTAREVLIVDRPVLILQCDQPTTLNADGAHTTLYLLSAGHSPNASNSLMICKKKLISHFVLHLRACHSWHSGVHYCGEKQ